MGKHRIGYAGINTTLGLSPSKTCRLRNISEERLAGLIEENLDALRQILRWNEVHQIGIFRISSGIIPYGSHDLNRLNWPVIFGKQMAEVGTWAVQRGMRLTMHPGQYVNINSTSPGTYESSVFDLIYHATVLGTMGLDTASKMVIHVGGMYGDKRASLQRFIKAYHQLPDAVKRRLVVEHDDRIYTVWDVLEINQETGIPVVFDNLHHEVNNTGTYRDQDIRAILERCFKTWEPERDGPPKIHFASQKPDARRGNHAEAIDISAFLEFFGLTQDLDYDVVFECKDKEQSVLRAQEALGMAKFSNLTYAV